MTTPNDHPDHRPPRAEPLQPDKPAQGRDRQHDRGDAKDTGAKTAERQKEQSEAALDNVRKGYD